MERYKTSERDLIVPALKILFEYGADDQLVPTKILTKELRIAVQPTPADRIMLKGRKDDRYSQVVRNLVSHRTLERKGLAVYQTDPDTGEHGYKLTEMGIETLRQFGIEIERKTLNRIGQLWLPLDDI
jgi:hypothetical protein